MLNDNETNFVGTEKVIVDLVSCWDNDHVKRMTANHGVTWHWNPMLAPHYWGVFDSMMKCVVRVIYAVLRGEDVNDEDLQKVFRVENLTLKTKAWKLGSVDTATFNPRRRRRSILRTSVSQCQKWFYPTENLNVVMDIGSKKRIESGKDRVHVPKQWQACEKFWCTDWFSILR